MRDLERSNSKQDIRSSLFRPVPIGVTDDFVISTRVIARGYRLVFTPDAVAYEPEIEGDVGSLTLHKSGSREHAPTKVDAVDGKIKLEIGAHAHVVLEVAE